jgi:ABC-2 type transport system permease protein
MGTMVRLQASPLTRFQVLSGKALACFITVMCVIAMMIGLGVALGMDPVSYPKLILAALCVAFCFVGIMMTMAVLGKTEQSVNGTGWAINMVMAMIGGGMIPVMFMPAFMQKLSVLSPVKWSILGIEGAIWRDFSYGEMAFPCGVLLAIGVVGMLLGSQIMKRRGS